jgi:hypothetical protein
MGILLFWSAVGKEILPKSGELNCIFLLLMKAIFKKMIPDFVQDLLLSECPNAKQVD